jgi:hypothetical protein
VNVVQCAWAAARWRCRTCRRRRGVAVAAARWRTCSAGGEVEQKVMVLWRAGGAEERVWAADGGCAVARGLQTAARAAVRDGAGGGRRRKAAAVRLR